MGDDFVGCFGWCIVITLVLGIIVALIIYVVLPCLAICAAVGLAIGLWCTGRNYISVIRETFFETGVQHEE